MHTSTGRCITALPTRKLCVVFCLQTHNIIVQLPPLSFEAKTFMQLNSKKQNLTFFFCVSLHCLILCSLNQYPSMWRQCFIIYSIFLYISHCYKGKRIGGVVIQDDITELWMSPYVWTPPQMFGCPKCLDVPNMF